MAITCLFLLFISSVLAAGVLLYGWGRWASGRSDVASTRVSSSGVPLPPELPAAPPPAASTPWASSSRAEDKERLALDDSSELRVADDELAYLWSDTEDRRDLWRADSNSIPPIEELRRAVDAALESGDRKEIAFAKAALADALDPTRLDITHLNPAEDP